MQNDENIRAGTASLAQEHEAVAEALLQIEQIALDMIGCPEEKLPELLEQRQSLIEGIEARQKACAGREPSDAQEAARIQDADGQALAAVCRIKDIDRQVMARMKRARERILDKLRSVGKSAGAKAARYYQPMSSKTSVYNGSM